MTKVVVSLSMLALSAGGCQKAEVRKVENITASPVTKGPAAERTEMPEAPRYPTVTEEPAPPSPQIRLVPEDMVSQVGQTPLQVLIDNFGRQVGQKLLGDVAAAVKILTWPEKNEVAVNVRITDAVERREDGYRVYAPGIVTVAPVVQLDSSRWYALTVGTLPPGIIISKTAVLTNSAGTSIASRFTTGSDPRVARVRRCMSGSGGGKIIVDFSERVMTSATSILSARADAACTVYVPDSASGTSETITALCNSLDRAAPIEIVLGSLMAQSGVPIRETGMRRFDASSFAPWGDCEVAPAGSL